VQNHGPPWKSPGLNNQVNTVVDRENEYIFVKYRSDKVSGVFTASRICGDALRHVDNMTDKCRNRAVQPSIA